MYVAHDDIESGVSYLLSMFFPLIPFNLIVIFLWEAIFKLMELKHCKIILFFTFYISLIRNLALFL